jgi:hypothetical protein
MMREAARSWTLTAGVIITTSFTCPTFRDAPYHHFFSHQWPSPLCHSVSQLLSSRLTGEIIPCLAHGRVFLMLCFRHTKADISPPVLPIFLAALMCLGIFAKCQHKVRHIIKRGEIKFRDWIFELPTRKKIDDGDGHVTTMIVGHVVVATQQTRQGKPVYF